MSLPFPYGLYKIVNVANGNINIPPILPTIIPVVAAPEGAVWEVTPTPPLKLEFNVHHLVNILKDAQPANLDKKHEGLLPSDKGIVVIHIDALPDVWCLHHVFGNVYLIYFSRKGTEHHGPYHWQLLSPKPGTNVIVDTDSNHPINKLLHGHIIAGLEASLDELTEKLKELHKHHPECFWEFQPLEK